MSTAPEDTNPDPAPLPGQATAALDAPFPQQVHIVLRTRLGGKQDIEGVYADDGDASRVAKRLSEDEFARHAHLHTVAQYTYAVTSEPLWPSEAAAGSPSREALLEATLTGLLAGLDDDCRLDHSGNCQAHFVEAPCRVAAARTLLGIAPPSEQASGQNVAATGDDGAERDISGQTGAVALPLDDAFAAVARDCRWWETVAPPGHTLHGWTDRQRAQFRSAEPFARIVEMDGAIAAHIHIPMGRQGGVS